MLTDEQIYLIRKYVPEHCFSQERLIKYLSIHDTVGAEVFLYATKEYYHERFNEYMNALPVMFDEKKDDRWEDKSELPERIPFEPESTDVFVHRIPFNFYYPGDLTLKDRSGDEYTEWSCLGITDFLNSLGSNPISKLFYHREEPLTLEDMYQKLELLFYKENISLHDIFAYPDSICWSKEGDMIGDWFDYIDMCLELGWKEFMPKNFYFKYNLAREALGKEPIIFYLQEYDPEAWQRDPKQVEFFQRNGNSLELYGIFPCDDNGKPILRWVGIDIRNAEDIWCEKVNELESLLTIELGPRTVVRAQIHKRDKDGKPLLETEPEWVQFYAGPQNMEFNYEVLKKKRKALGYTQQQVAEAIQANVRTYQKWENGETQPDGYYLLRIMNWLDIRDVNDLIVYGRE